jgi:hypothetical protein
MPNQPRKTESHLYDHWTKGFRMSTYTVSPYLMAAAERAALPIRVIYTPPRMVGDRFFLKEAWHVSAGRVEFTASKPEYALHGYLEAVRGLR